MDNEKLWEEYGKAIFQLKRLRERIAQLEQALLGAPRQQMPPVAQNNKKPQKRIGNKK